MKPSWKVGLGTWKCDQHSCEETVYTAIKCGYRYIDCAYEYLNEEEIGRGIEQAINEGICTRAELFIASKLWQTYHRPELVEKELDLSLTSLRLSYLDLFVIHWPLEFLPGSDLYPRMDGSIQKDSGYSLQDTWRAMEQLVYLKKVKNIGVSNYNVELLLDLFSYCRIRPFSNEIEIHPFLEEQKLADFCISNEVIVTAYSPLCGNYDYGGHQNASIASNELLELLADKHNCTVQEIVLSWHLESHNKQYYNIIVKSENLERELLNFLAKEILSTEELNEINGMDLHARKNDAGNVFWQVPVFD